MVLLQSESVKEPQRVRTCNVAKVTADSVAAPLALMSVQSLVARVSMAINCGKIIMILISLNNEFDYIVLSLT